MNPVILIVDDEPSARETLEGILFDRGYELVLAENGREALKKAKEVKPDLILMDVMMPEMDGFEVCRNLRKDPLLAEVPVIMITALDDQDSYIKGIEAGEVGTMLDVDHNIACRTGLLCAPLVHEQMGTDKIHGMVRIGIGPFNTEENINALIEAVKEIASISKK